MKFTVRDCDPNTGVPEEDGYDDEYVVSSGLVGFFFLSLILNACGHWVNDFLSDLKPCRREQQGCLKHHFQNIGSV